MSPIEVIVWTCVFIFIVTAVIALLPVTGVRSLPNQRHGEVLFKVLIVEIAIIAVPIRGRDSHTLSAMSGTPGPSDGLCT